MDELQLTGTPFGTTYKRTTSRPMDSSEIFDTIEDARVYAKNTDKIYVPYPGQIISVRGGAVYKLVIDSEMSDDSAEGFYHCKLDIIGGNNDNDDRYVRKDIAETVQKLMTFLEGINVKGMATLEEITLLRDIVSQNFAKGSTGFGIYRDESGNYHLDIDFVDIRKKLTAEEIQVQRSYYVGGKQWITPGSGIVCTSVEDTGPAYRCHFKATDADGREVKCLFQTGDYALCETFNLNKQVGGALGNHYYWRLVAGVGADYIDLSKSECGVGSDAPVAGDEIVQLGNESDESRQGAVCHDAMTAGGPYIRIYKGITDPHLPEPKIDLNPTKSRIIAQLISEATGKDVDTVLDEMKTDIKLVKDQTDRSYIIWIENYDPTLSNKPASDWDTNALKVMHEQDMFYNKDTGYGWRFEKVGDVWAWNNITDQQTLRALELIKEKCKVFVLQPTANDAYSVGDMWVNATYSDANVSYKNDSLVCKIAKSKGVAFSISHWEPSSTATTAYLENLGDQILIAVSNADDGIEAAKELARQGISDAYDAAQDALDALGIARGAQGAADENTAAIQVTKDSISALVEGIHFDASGNITNIDTSGLVTTDDFNVLLSKKVNFDSGGHITNISTSGLVTEAGFAQMFSEKAFADGYVKRAEISTFITEDDAGRLISNAVIRADQIDLTGKVTISMLANDLKGSLDGKADASGLGDLAYKDAVEKASLGSTVISGGYLLTSLINVDELVVKHISGGTGDFTGTVNMLDGSMGGFTISNNSIRSAENAYDGGSGVNGYSGSSFALYAGGYSSAFLCFKSSQKWVGIGLNCLPAGTQQAMGRFEDSESDDYTFSKTGLYISISGAPTYDDPGFHGNSALYIPKGHISGYRRRLRRVNSSMTLSVMDSILICKNAGEITVTLPSGAEDGQEFWLISVNRKRVNVVAPSGDTITASGETFSTDRWHVYVYDAFSRLWLYSYMNYN